MGDYTKLKSRDEEVVEAGFKFLERCKLVKVQISETKADQMSKDHPGNESKCSRADSETRNAFERTRRNAVCEEQFLERDGLVIILRDHILQIKLESYCLI